MAPAPRKQKSVAYLLWCLGFFGLCGVHRLYTERYLLGILYLFTFGFCFLGQLIDLLLIPDDVGSFNASQRQRAVARLTPSRPGPGPGIGSGPDAQRLTSAPPARPQPLSPASESLSERTRSLLAEAQASIERLDQQR
jgi:TM2 domain-containing membrane protein YozV